MLLLVGCAYLRSAGLQAAEEGWECPKCQGSCSCSYCRKVSTCSAAMATWQS